jgi:hypothetical protein
MNDNHAAQRSVYFLSYTSPKRFWLISGQEFVRSPDRGHPDAPEFFADLVESTASIERRQAILVN